MTRILFVCLGNICRSPLAESVFRHLARERGVEVSGASRKLTAADLHRFDYVIAMDQQNLSDLRALAREHGGDARIHLLREFDPEPGDLQVPDPYYGGPEGFDDVFAMVHRACSALLDHLEQERAGDA